jgi:alpha-L-fucosidase
VTTSRGDRIYLHVLDRPAGDALTLPRPPRRVVSARLLAGGRLSHDETGDGLSLRLPPSAPGEYDTVVVLELAPRRPAVTRGGRARRAGKS